MYVKVLVIVNNYHHNIPNHHNTFVNNKIKKKEGSKSHAICEFLGKDANTQESTMHAMGNGTKPKARGGNNTWRK